MRIGPLAMSHQPTKGWCGTPKAYGLPPGGLAPLVNIWNPFVTLGTFSVMPKTFSNQMRSSYISIFVSGPFQKPS